MTYLKFRVIVVCLAAVLALGITLPLMAQSVIPPILQAPADGAEVFGGSVTFFWGQNMLLISEVDLYTLQISSQSDFSSTIVNISSIKGMSTTVNTIPQDGSLYYWRVRVSRPLHISGGWNIYNSPWSAPRTFLAQFLPPVPPPASLISPAQGAQVTKKSVAFNWSPSTGAVKYHLQVSTQNNFISTFYNMEDIKNSNYSVPSFPQNGSTYYWRVKAINAVGQGDWSQVRSFVSAPPPQPPSPPSYAEPANGATVSGSAVALIWNASAGATRYHLQVARQPGFPITNLFFTNENITATQYAVPGLPNDGTKLYWRVRAFKEEGGWSAWNNDGFQTRHFVNGQSQEPPGVPLLVLPAQGAVISENSVALSWRVRVSSGVVKYHVQIGNTSSFTTIFFNSDNINGTSFTWSNFPPGVGRYYWRVRACNAAGVWGDWSETRMFNTN